MFMPNGEYGIDLLGNIVPNTVGQILSAALMLEYSFGLVSERKLMEDSVQDVLQRGFHVDNLTPIPPDVDAANQPSGRQIISAEEFGNKVVEAMQTLHNNNLAA